MRIRNLGGVLISDESYLKPLEGLQVYKVMCRIVGLIFESILRYINVIYHSHTVSSSHSTLSSARHCGRAPGHVGPDQALQEKLGV